MHEQKSLSLDRELWSEIDKKRGDVSRSRFIAKILAEILDASQEDLPEQDFQTSDGETQ